MVSNGWSLIINNLLDHNNWPGWPPHQVCSGLSTGENVHSFFELNMPDWSRPFTFDFLMQRIDLLANLNFDSFSHLRQRLTKIFTVFSTSKRQRMHMDALETIQTYANLLNQSLNFNPLVMFFLCMIVKKKQMWSWDRNQEATRSSDFRGHGKGVERPFATGPGILQPDCHHAKAVSTTIH